jgi:hypothetical protein
MSQIYVNGQGGGANSAGKVFFNAARENQRPALQLVGNIVYVAFASHADYRPYHGWVLGFDKTTLQPIKVFNTAPNADGVGIWESGGSLSFDANGYMYFAVGNGFNGPYSAYDPAHGNYSESVLKIDPTPNWSSNNPQMMAVVDYFTPYDWQQLDNQDADLGSGGVMLLPDGVGSAAHPHLMVETGKAGKIYLIDRDNMGKYTPGGPDNVVQTVTAGQTGVWGNAAFFQVDPSTGIIYYHGSGDVLKGYYITNGHIDSNSADILRSNYKSLFPGTQPSISADGISNPTNPENGIVWELQVDNAIGRIQGVSDNTTAGPATLRAFSATDFSTELYDSSQTGQRDFFGGSVKFTFPVVTNGQVLIGTADHFSVLGLFPSATQPPNAPSDLTAQAYATSQGARIVLNWTNPAPNPGADPTGIKIFRSTDGVNFTYYNTVNRNLTSFTDPGPFQIGQQYYYQVVATNQQGDSAPSNTASAVVPLDQAVLTVTGTGSSFLNLSWTPVAMDHYDIERSTDGVNFAPVATVPAYQTTYTDTGLVPGLYSYRIHAYNINPDADSLSNVEGAWVGPVIDHGTPDTGGFADSTDLTETGSSAIVMDVANLTYGMNQTGSIFSNTRIAFGSFTTTFEVRLHEGSQPNYADGFTFVLQANSPTALGMGGAGIGYQGIGHSAAVKFSTYKHPGDPSDSTTGLVLNGANPGGGISTIPSGVLLNSQDIKLVTLSYDGSLLQERIQDIDTGQVFIASYVVNLAQVLGTDTAYVGFTGATGSGGFWQIEDILSWQFTSLAAVPGAPRNLRVTSSTSSELDLAWDGNSFNETGFSIERSTDGTNFTPIATTTNTSYQDVQLANGVYYYRVLAFNDAGNSPYSPTLQTGLPAPILTDHQDIGTPGDPGIAGTATFANGTYTLTASGSDVWGTSDHFQYLYRPFLGDGEIIARVVTEGSASGLDKAGLMFRDSLADDAKNAFMLEFPSPGSRDYPTYQWRADTGGQTMDHELSTAHGVPIWLRLVRSGTLFIGYWAVDTGNGTHGPWNQLGAETVPMGNTVYVGLALTSHNNSKATTATFDYVQIISATPQATHFDVTADPNVVTSGTPVTITVTVLDQYNNVVTGYTGTIHFTSGDPAGATLPDDYTFQPSDQGVATFVDGAILYTPGTWDVTATDTNSGIYGSAYVTVTSAPRSAFPDLAPAVDTFPPSTADMGTFSGGVTVVTPGDQSLTVPHSAGGINGNLTVSGMVSPLTTGGDLGGGVALEISAPNGFSTSAPDSSLKGRAADLAASARALGTVMEQTTSEKNGASRSLATMSAATTRAYPSTGDPFLDALNWGTGTGTLDLAFAGDFRLLPDHSEDDWLAAAFWAV